MKNTMIFLLLAASVMLVCSCDAGGHLNDEATCADVGQSERYCKNQINGNDVLTEEYAELVAAVCEAQIDNNCVECIFDKPCSPADGMTSLDHCVEAGLCKEYDLGD